MPRGRTHNASTRVRGPEPERNEEIAERRARALEEPLDFRRLAGPFVRLEVRNPIHGTHYRVMLPSYPSRDAAMCTCTDFSRSGLGTCKHLEAAFRWMGVHPEEVADPEPTLAEPAPSWAEVDRRIRSIPHGASPARRMTWSGEVLVETKVTDTREKEGVGHRPIRGPKA